MSRQQKHRRRARKARRQARKAAIQDAEARGLPFPSRRPDAVPRIETRDPRTRWLYLGARGGLRLSFRGSGRRIPVDFDDPAAEHALALSLTAPTGDPTAEG